MMLTVDDKGSPIEEDTGHLVGVRGELLTSEQAVEDQARVGQTAWLDSERRNGPAVGSISRTQLRLGRVVVRAVCGTVFIIIAHHAVQSCQ
jgi:hypothetical protein